MSTEQYILGAYLLGLFYALGYTMATFIALESIDKKPRALWPCFLLALFSWALFIGMYLLLALTVPEKKD